MKMLYDVLEAIIFIVVLSSITKFIKYFNIEINGIIIVIVLLILWVSIKLTLVKYLRNRRNNKDQ